MKNKLFILALTVITLLASCSKEDGDGDSGGTSFTPPAQEQLTQNAFADNENTGGGFSFTTDSPWTATVEEVQAQSAASAQVKSATRTTGNNVVWLKLYNGNSEAYSGGAGTITLRIEIEQNYTGERREATITIRSGNNTFIVTVIQEGTKQDGSENEPPVKVTKITLDKTELSMDAGAKATLSATVEPDNATVKSVVWSSSDPAVVSVNPVTGEITAITDGTATVTATSSSNKEVSASCTVTVGNNEPVAPIAIISEIERTVTYWDQLPTSKYYEEEATYMFKYDDQNRVSSYTVDIRPTNDRQEACQLVSTIDYSSADRLRIKDQWSDTGIETYEVLLNEKGYGIQSESYLYTHDEEDNEIYTYELEYDNEDRLSRIAYSFYWTSFTYKDGVMSGGADFDGNEVYETSGFEQYFNQIPNDKMNLDINLLFMPSLLSEEPEGGDVPGRLGRLALLRFLGRGTDHYISMFLGGVDEVEGNLSHMGGWPEPNVTVPQSYDDYAYDEDVEIHLNYTLNENGSVASVVADMPIVKIRHEYEIVSGEELFDPNHPEAGYKYEIRNKKDTELDRGTNSITYTFTYR